MTLQLPLIENRPRALGALVAIALVAALAACDPRKPQAAAPMAGTARAEVIAPVHDASLPSADAALAAAPKASAPTAQDSATTRPHAELSKTEESSTMPKAKQANNHSSPAADAASSR